VILGIDPGTRKAGYALVDLNGTVLAQGIEAIDGLIPKVSSLRAEREIETVALGKGTNAPAVQQALVDIGLAVSLVDETETTLRARRLYFADNPPRGWRRLIPLGMQLPPRPIDDYAAVLIARRYLESRIP
jgi:RNase H-fold protein (predicted Holliday junction resolvase)